MVANQEKFKIIFLDEKERVLKEITLKDWLKKEFDLSAIEFMEKYEKIVEHWYSKK